MDGLFLVMELVGTVAFAVSGAIKGVQRELDLFGVIILGVVTAVGGGVVRDLVIGRTPPLAFCDPQYVLIAITVSLLLFLVLYIGAFRASQTFRRLLAWLLTAADTVGLAAFTVLGIESTLRFAPESGVTVLLFVGVISGIGGGILSDSLSGSVPHVFKKHIYAVASLAGAVTLLLLMRVLPRAAATLIAFFVVIALRLCAIRFRCNLPRIKLEQ